MRQTFLVLAAALVAAPLSAASLPALAAPGSQAPGGVGVSCDAVRADPSLYARRVIQECRHRGWQSEPLAYSGGGRLYQPNGGMTDLVTRNSSCSDVRMRPDLYSASIQESCAAGSSNAPGDWGGALVR